MTPIRKLLFMLMLLAPTVLMAQDQGQISIKTTALVIEHSEIELITIKDLEIDESMAFEGKIYIAAQSDPKSGVMLVKGRPNANIRITYLPEMLLINSYGNGDLKFYYEVYGYPTDNQSASEPLEMVDRMMRLSKEGNYYLWVGGHIDFSNAWPGNYEGEFTLEIEYL
jgi:hypothetical protein